LIYEEGDYFGSTVNIAARIAAQEGPDHVLGRKDVLTLTLTDFRVDEG
jgi:class 3 adenylate cyclase